MSRLLVLGDPVVSLGGQALIADGGIVVEDTTIVAVGPREQVMGMGPFDRQIGSAGHFVMPGFVNCHYHSELAIGPGLYQHIFEKANVHIQGSTGPISAEDLYDGIMWGLITAIKGGQTGVVDMYYGRPSLPDFGCEAALQAYADVGIRTAFGLVSRDQNKYAHEADAQFLARLPAELAGEVRNSPMGYAWPVDEVMASYRRLAARWHGYDGRIHLVTAPDWTPACSDELYRRCRREADEFGSLMITHALETRAEMAFNLHAYGKPAVRRLADLGVLTPATVLEHFVWVTDEELRIFADSGAVASNNPGSNLRLSTGICRLRDIMEAGGRVAFGTDGISFSDRDDMFTELVVKKERIMFPPGRYTNEPFLDVVIDRTDSLDIDTVLVHGRVLMENGRVTTVDEDQVKRRFAAAVAERVYRPSAQQQRYAELGALVEPYLTGFYRPWYELPVEPAHVYNATHVPADPGGPGAS